MYGDVSVSGIPRAVNILIFQPGTDLSGYSIDTALGYPAVVVIDNLNDPQRVAQPELVSDTCSAMSATVSALGLTADNPDTAANEGGLAHLTNPAPSGAYTMS